MSYNEPVPHPHLAWRVMPLAAARAQLFAARYPGLPGEEGQTGGVDVVGILYAYGVESAAEIVTWLRPADAEAVRRLRREGASQNSFDGWLRRHWPVDFWTLMTAWTFYEQWLTNGKNPHWRVGVMKVFPPDEFIDQILFQSRGWLLWRSQLEMLLDAAVGDLYHAKALANAWATQLSAQRVKFNELRYPNGANVRAALQERSYRTIRGRAIFFESPNIPAAARIHAIFAALKDKTA